MENEIIKAILFDLDGTIVDTEKYYRLYWPKAFAKFGYPLKDEQGLNLRSLGRPYLEEYLTNVFGKRIEIEEIKKYARSLVDMSISENGLDLKDGVVECLEFLKTRSVKLAIVTATAEERARKYLQQVNVEKYFDNVISAKNVEHGKPAPDVYLTACEKLNIIPENSIAVEDSPNGVISAYRAGCKVVMVPDQTEPDEELKKCLFAKLSSLKDFEGFATFLHYNNDML